ncbi:hypothetical protein DM793_12755 [Paenarthrobacter nitroguajacolicus]|uniref:DUF2247 family protein n=1 Tax=Paenarthrobacter nitroguajacolicus TaxID=211146 RepID=UPI0015BCA35D|nr:DUF2247 family protein [Paenarthrobacter nitroguajacolicus]NWL12152.1 hypothetical protein [Paenarthrobacter nitroguajacolicus]
MSQDLVKFHIPSDFILSRALPTLSEIAYGFAHSWTDEQGVVTLALARYIETDTDPVTEDLALLLSRDHGRVLDILYSIDEWDLDVRKLWLYLSLAWMYENRTSFDDVWVTIDMLYADFGNPAEIRGFNYNMRPLPGEAVGHAAMDRRWRKFLDQEFERYRLRRQNESSRLGLQ